MSVDVVSGALMQIAAGDDDSLLERFVADLPAERLAPVLLQVRDLQAKLRKAGDWIEGRYGEEIGESYTDPEGEVYVFTGDPTWKVSDAEGFAAELDRIAKSKPAWAGRIREAYERTWKFSHSVLNSLRDVDDEIGDVVKEWRTRTYGPKHLRKFDR